MYFPSDRYRSSYSRREVEEMNALQAQRCQMFKVLAFIAITCYWLPQAALLPEYHASHDFSRPMTEFKKKIVRVESSKIEKKRANETKSIQRNHNEKLAVYHFIDTFPEPQFLDLIEPTVVSPHYEKAVSKDEKNNTQSREEEKRSRLYLDIDKVHKGAYLHHCVWVLIADSDQKLLLLRRAPTLMTCPDTWGFLGEHSLYDEPIDTTLHRGFYEELKIDTDVWDAHVVEFQNLTSPHLPVYYIRDYGPSNGYRLEKQLTWLILVKFNITGESLEESFFNYDDEVADSKWLTKEEVIKEIEEHPDEFCHSSIRELALFALNLIPST